MRLITTVFAFILAACTAWALPTRDKVKNIIIDTDFLSFPDDVGAIALANQFQRKGKARILGIASNVNSRFSIPAIDGINTWYCHPRIPFAQTRTVTNSTAEPDTDPISIPVFITTLANSTLFPEDIHDGSNNTIHAPLDFYHDILSRAEDKSVTILAIGFMNNLYDLYHSPGGKELIQAKVIELVVEGGDFAPTVGGQPNSAGYNLVTNLTAATVVEYWPTPVTYLGDNVGSTVFTGQFLNSTPESNPVRAAYHIFQNGSEAGASWDLLTTYYGVLGIEEGSFQYGNENRGGRLQIFPNKTAVWNFDIDVPKSQRQHFLAFKESNVTIARKVNALLDVDQKPICS